MEMERQLRSRSRDETAAIGRALAREIQAAKVRPAFLSLKGELGAGKSELARAFIAEWLVLTGATAEQAMPSPTFNVAIVYGERNRIAHLDLYRLSTMAELEQLGFEHYFYEQDCCVVEWLDRIPGAAALAPAHRVEIELTFIADDESSRRLIVRGLKTPS